MASIKCEKCGKVMDEGQFYTYKDGKKTELCKKCLTMHVDANDPTTFLWLLEKMNVPYIPAEWQVLVDKSYAKDPLKFSSMAVFGKYLSKMKLKQWKEYGWEDGPRLIAEAQEKAGEIEKQNEERDAFYKEKFENGEITESEYKTYTSTGHQMNTRVVGEGFNPFIGVDNPYNENNFLSEDEIPDPGNELTKEDKLFLASKWGRMYKPSEWVALELDYHQMMNSFDIQDADSLNTLILICKTNLKMNQFLDNGDIEGFQKLSKVSESLRKSAKFTAAQNKEAKGDFVDSIGELVRICEKDGFIPRFATDIPQDKVDLTLQDMTNYLNKLVTQDLGFGQQIEDAIKKIQIQKEMNDSANQDVDLELEDEDFVAFNEEKERQKDLDEEMIENESNDEED